MQRAVLHDVRNLSLEEAPRPACPEGGFLIRVEACAVCATDIKIANYGHHLLKPPRVLGHEIAGTIEEIGRQCKTDFVRGSRVAVCAVINCGECRYCRRALPSMCERLRAFGYHYDGGFQEYMAVPAEAVRCGGVNPIPASLSSAEASLAELLACCLNGQRLSGLALGESLLILGAGPVGILQAQLASARGVTAVYLADPVESRLAAAEAICGPALTRTFPCVEEEALREKVKQATDGYGVDQVMVCCSAPSAQRAALACVAKFGCVNLFGGLPQGDSQVVLDTNLIHYKQCRITGTHGSSSADNCLALALLAAGKVKGTPLITDRIHLTELESVLLGGTRPGSLKKVVVYDA